MLIKLNPAMAGSVEDMVTGSGCAMAGSYKVRSELSNFQIQRWIPPSTKGWPESISDTQHSDPLPKV